MSSTYDLAQTIYIDANATKGAPSVSITAVDLYIYSKPTQGKNVSGIYAPGMTVAISRCLPDNSPDITTVEEHSLARVEWASINANTTGAQATTFSFRRPITVPTNSMVAILIRIDGRDPGMKFWYNKAGQTVLGTQTKTSVTNGKVDGNLYKLTNAQSSLTPEKDADLSFKLYTAVYDISTSRDVKIINRPYEILKVTNRSANNFIGGEDVYAGRANAAGTVAVSSNTTTITGVGTSFTSLAVGDRFVITDGSLTNTNVRQVVSVANNTQLVIDTPPSFTNTSSHYFKTVTGTLYYQTNLSDHIIIQDSTANSTVYLGVGNVVYGVDSRASAAIATIESYAVNAIKPSFVFDVPSLTTANMSFNMANSNFQVTSSTAQVGNFNSPVLLDKYPAVIASRSVEVTQATPFRSFQSTVTISSTNKYVSPSVHQNDLDVFMYAFDVNNDTTNEYTSRGNAKSRYISRTVSLGANKTAEDLKVFLRAYKPANTNIKVYAKFRKSTDIQSMDLKAWTEMTLDKTGNVISSGTNNDDFLELPYVLPFQPTGTQQDGTFTTSSGNAVVTGISGTVNTGLTVNDLVSIANPYFSNTYMVGVVTAANTTTFTLSTAVSNTSLVGSGFHVNKITRPTSGFLDVQNANILTYYNSSLSQFVGYDQFQLKVVLLSENNYKVPYVDDIRAISVSA